VGFPSGADFPKYFEAVLEFSYAGVHRQEAVTKSDSPWPVFPQFAKQFSAFDELETRRIRFFDYLG